MFITGSCFTLIKITFQRDILYLHLWEGHLVSDLKGLAAPAGMLAQDVCGTLST